MGQGGVSPSTGGNKMEIIKCLDDLWSTPKSVFCNAILYIINIGKTHFKLQDCKNRPSIFLFLLGGDGHAERKRWKKWKSENA